MEKAKKKFPFSVFEFIVYIFAILMVVWGIVYLSLGVAVNFVNYQSSIITADNHLKSTTNMMGFLEQGFLVLSIGVGAGLICLLITAKKSDKEFEKTQRRAARIAARKESEIVDAKVEEVNEAK